MLFRSILDSTDLVAINSDIEDMRKQAKAALDKEGFSAAQQHFTQFMDLRYSGQEHSVTLPVSGNIDAKEIAHMKEIFGEAHERAYGHTMPDPIELVSLRFSARGEVEAPELPFTNSKTERKPAPSGNRDVYVGGGKRVPYALYNRDDLAYGDTIHGQIGRAHV